MNEINDNIPNFNDEYDYNILKLGKFIGRFFISYNTHDFTRQNKFVINNFSGTLISNAINDKFINDKN